MIWDCILPDGSNGYIRYRWSVISLKAATEKAGIFQEPIISEMIGSEDRLDGMLPLEDTIKWLETNGYNVINHI